MKFAIRNYALLFLGCVLFHVIGTWSLPLIDRDEPRFAEASREMIERDNYVVPHFNNGLRLDKPPLAYWAQVASYKIFGQNDFSARFPSAIAAALIALSIFAWGRRIGAERVGWWSAIIFSLSLQTFVHAKAAVADMWLVLFMTLAHRAGWELIQHRTSNVERPTSNQGAAVSRPPWAIWRSPFLVFYFSLALGFLAKGPIGWTPLLTIASVRLFAPDVAFAKQLKFFRGVLLMLAIVALWGIPALIRTNGEFLAIGIGRHVIGRSFGAMEGHGASSLGLYLLLLPFYFVTVFVSLFPWSIKLPSLAKQLWRSRDKIDIYLLTGAAVIFIVFSVIKTKLPHYTLPAFPLLALLLARHIESRRFLKTAAIVTICVYLAFALIVPPMAAKLFPAAQLYRQSRDHLRPEMEFAAVAFQEPSLVWYFRSRIHGWMLPANQTRVSEFMNKPGPRFAVLPTTVAAEIFSPMPTDWTTFSMHGFNVAKGKAVDLTLVLKPD